MYRGRFAPSPTGALHFGSLIAAVGSYLQAKSLGGEWLIRIEDIDPPREQLGAADSILKTLETFGFEWDGSILYQSTRLAAYEDTLSTLKARKLLYPCACTRKEIADSAHQGIEGAVYPGTCRSGLNGRTVRAWRVITTQSPVEFTDAIQGMQHQSLQKDIGDFVLRRADGLYAYQLAVVVDDAAQGINHIVRGADLLDSTPRQIYLQQLLGLATPEYAHLPVAVNLEGEKLSKQTRAMPVSLENPVIQLWKTLMFLGQCPPHSLQDESLNTLWDWAKQNWVLNAVPKVRMLPHLV